MSHPVSFSLGIWASLRNAACILLPKRLKLMRRLVRRCLCRAAQDSLLPPRLAEPRGRTEWLTVVDLRVSNPDRLVAFANR